MKDYMWIIYQCTSKDASNVRDTFIILFTYSSHGKKILNFCVGNDYQIFLFGKNKSSKFEKEFYKIKVEKKYQSFSR